MKRGDKRWRVRAAKHAPPLWPLALELARSGLPIGVWVAHVGEDLAVAVVVEGDGTLWEVRRLLVSQLVRWCLRRHLRIFHSLGAFVEAEQAGHVIGWVPGQIVEHKAGRQWLAPAVPFDASRVVEVPSAWLAAQRRSLAEGLISEEAESIDAESDGEYVYRH